MFVSLCGIAMFASLVLSAPVLAQSDWTTVANNGDVMPGSTMMFNSYNQPSVNTLGFVVFRARSKGGSDGQPVHGIYTRNMKTMKPVTRVFDRTTLVPDPNNTGVTFVEFPSIPRVDMVNNILATRGNSQPVWDYLLPDGTETKIGTSGLFMQSKATRVSTAANQLGGVPDKGHYGVPGAPPATKFDQFPGSPAINNLKIVFKGNYTEDGAGKTGIYFRDTAATDGPVQLIANTGTRIPNQGKAGMVTFGSTAPPSAALGTAVFAGFDNEDNPTMGGIYWSALKTNAKLITLVGIGQQVPGEAAGVQFTKFGEGLSYDGRYVGFWGAWGTETKTLKLYCPTDGNEDLLAYCNQQYPNGYDAVEPVNQGIFIHDTLTKTMTTLAKSPADFDDFMYWTFSGKTPGTGGSDDGEPARWRNSAFTAVSKHALNTDFQAVLKAKKAGVDGLYYRGGLESALTALIDTTTAGLLVDPKAPAGSTIVAIGIERESMRRGWLTLTASMLDAVTSESWGGIYSRYIP